MKFFALILLLGIPAMSSSALPEPSAQSLPRWRGFNLLERFRLDSPQGDFKEEDFKLISGLGFNFVRLPMDYRYWIKNNDWAQIDEAQLKAVDDAIAFGKKYNLHVCLNLHRAPGYCINPPKEAKNLWTDPEAQKVCALHWRTFAKRYKGIPNSELSFDLVNEPSGIDGATYAKAAAILVKAIRAEDPGRLIIADGREGGGTPVPELLPLGIAQSGRGYQPFGLTHYQASWVEGSMNWPVPEWPGLRLTTYLYGPQKKELQGILLLTGHFPKGTKVRVRVGQVSSEAKLEIRSGGKVLASHDFKPGAGKGEWTEELYDPQWKIYQNRYALDLNATLSSASDELQIEVTAGDWLKLSEIQVLLPGRKGAVIRPKNESWGAKPARLVFNADGSLNPVQSGANDLEWLKREVLGPWLDLRAKGAGVMIGEWGVYDKTPHAVTLAFMEDMLKAMKESGLGWALWNFRGGFGPVDTERRDVKYEEWNGHKLDRKMMDLLQKY